MKIQSCKQCGEKFNYLLLLESIGWGYKPLYCSNCGAKHRFKKHHIFILVFLLFLPVFFINYIHQFALTGSIKLIIILTYMAYVSFIMALYPYIIGYKLENKIES